MAALATLLALLALPSAAFAQVGETLSFSKSTSMYSNATDTVNGQPRPATLLRLQSQRFTVRSVPLGTIRAGETIRALSEVEITNDLVTKDAEGNNVYHDAAVEAALILATSPTATTGIEIGESQASTVTPQVHHWTFEKSAAFHASTSYSGRYLNLVMWASTPQPLTGCWTFPRSGLPNPQQPRDCGVDVYYDRGHLSVLREAGSGSAPAGATPFSVQSFDGPSLLETSPVDAPITYSGEPAQPIVALARPVGTLRRGDILAASSHLQADARNVVRSNTSCNVMVATRLYLSPSPNSLNGAVALGTEGGHNFTGRGARQIKTLEQGVVPSSATFKVGQNYTSPRYVILRVWTLGNSACALYGNGIRVQFSQPQSFVHVTRYREETRARLTGDTYNSGDNSERASTLDAVTGVPAVIYSLPIPQLAPGQTIEALAEMELDSAYHRAGVHTTLVLADSPSATTGVILQPDHFTELNPYMASLPIHDSAALVIPSGVSGTRYVNVVASAQLLQTLGIAPDDSISVAPDDGRLVVQRWRPAG